MQSAGTTDDQRTLGLTLRGWLLVLVGVSLLRLAVAAVAPVYETEAYYWLWSRHPAAGYFDHPPMLAWMCRITDFAGPPHALAMRLHGVLSHFAASIAMYYLGRNLFGSPRLGVLASLVYNAVPFQGVIAVQNQPDSPLLLFWVATAAYLERALATERRWWWIAAGACAGGALLSKFHGFVFVGFLFCYLLASRQDRRWLRTPWPWLALLTALAVYSPNFAWNARHEWQTYRFQFGGQGKEPGFKASHPAMTLLAPLANMSPWLFAATLAAWWRAVRSGDWIRVRERALPFWTTAPIFGLFLMASLRQQVKFHWAAPAFAMAAPVLAAEIARWTPRRRAWFLASGAGFTVAIYAYLVLAPFAHRVLPDRLLPPVPDLVAGQKPKADWMLHGFGWNEFGAILREEVAAGDKSAPTFILARRFDRAAMAGFAANMPERAWVLDPGPSYEQNYKDPDPRSFLGWENSCVREGSNAVYVFNERDAANWRHEMRMLNRCFREASPMQIREIARDGRVLRRFHFVRCTGFVPGGRVSGRGQGEKPAADRPSADGEP